jgi:sugar diacid utilization regulator
MRLIAYSSHWGPVDEVRAASIMHRKAPAKAIAWAHRHGIRMALEPVRMPPNPTIPMDARVCAPVRFRDDLLGYLWLIDTDQSLTDADLEVVKAAAEAAGEALHLEKLLDELQRGQERELLRDLLSDDAAVRRHAAEELVEADLMVPSRGAVAIVVQIASDAGHISSVDRLSIRIALDHVRQSLSPRHALHLIRPDHALLVVATDDATLRVGGVGAVARQLLDAVRGKLDDRIRVLVGIGDIRSEIAEIAGSYQRARQAARVAEIVPSFAPIAIWDELGIYRMLLQFPLEHIRANVLHPGLQALIAAGTNEDLVGTLETFLDLAGSAKRTASELKLHRATLYYRLRKIEEIVGVDLENGDDRLALHLGLKLARLAGLRPEGVPRGEPAVHRGEGPRVIAPARRSA